MPEEVLYIAFIAMVAVIMVNIVCAVYNIKAKRLHEKRHKELIDFLFGNRTEDWKHMGAYDAENGRMYLDLEGIRLVIFEGQIEGWYKP